jgi:hypothetical protein
MPSVTFADKRKISRRVLSNDALCDRKETEGFLPSFKMRPHRSESMGVCLQGRSQPDDWLDGVRQYRG